MTLYKLDRGEITEADANTVVNGCNSILVYAENELHAGWVGLLFDADKATVGTYNSGKKLIQCVSFPYLITALTATILLGIKKRQVQHYCQKLGFEKTGGIYLLTVGQVEEIHQVRLRNPIGRPKKTR